MGMLRMRRVWHGRWCVTWTCFSTTFKEDVDWFLLSFFDKLAVDWAILRKASKRYRIVIKNIQERLFLLHKEGRRGRSLPLLFHFSFSTLALRLCWSLFRCHFEVFIFWLALQLEVFLNRLFMFYFAFCKEENVSFSKNFSFLVLSRGERLLIGRWEWWGTIGWWEATLYE